MSPKPATNLRQKGLQIRGDCEKYWKLFLTGFDLIPT
jgi:hypothetical protein